MTPDSSFDPTIYVTAGADTDRDTHMVAALDQRRAGSFISPAVRR